MKKILVPIDGSDCSFAALKKAKEIAQAFGSQVVLLNVIDKNSADYPSHPYKFSPESLKKAGEEQEERKAISLKILEDGKAALSDLGENVTAICREGDAVDYIVKYSQRYEFDLVIMGSKGMSGLHAIGSVTRHVALKINKPILIIK